MMLLFRVTCVLSFAALALPARAQAPTPLRKSDLVALLAGRTYSPAEVAAIVRRSCLAFEPTERDLQDLRALGATEEILREMDRCQQRETDAGAVEAAPTPRPPRLAPALVVPNAIERVQAGDTARLTVYVRRGDAPVQGTLLALLAGDAAADTLRRTTPSARTGANGGATLVFPVTTTAGAYRLVISAPGSETVRAPLQLEVTAAAPAAAVVSPNPLALVEGRGGAQPVTVVVRDRYGNRVPGATVALRVDSTAPATRALVTMATDASGAAELRVPESASAADSLGVYVAGRRLATLDIAITRPVAAGPEGRIPALLFSAAGLATRGALPAAEAVYDSVLALDSLNVQARLGRGYVRSWQRRFALARADFDAVLSADSTSAAALAGLGYTNAWAGEFAAADTQFLRALYFAPRLNDAARGLGYSALWRGDARAAVRRFADASRRFPDDAALQVGLGQAYLQLGRPRDAERAFARALKLDPARADARAGLRAATAARTARVELTVWGGYSGVTAPPAGDLAAVRERGGGVRFAELALQPSPSVRVWAQFDNGLSLDNLTLLRGGETAPAFYLGGYGVIAGRYTTRLEGGWRSLPGRMVQTLMRAEEAVLVGSSTILKGGGWVGPRGDGRTEWLAYGGVNFPVAPRLRLEPVFFVAESGLPGASDRRGLLVAEYTAPPGWQLAGGLAYGTARFGPNVPSSSLWDGYVKGSVPVGGMIRVQLLVRRESVERRAALTVAALGLTVGF